MALEFDNTQDRLSESRRRLSPAPPTTNEKTQMEISNRKNAQRAETRRDPARVRVHLSREAGLNTAQGTGVHQPGARQCVWLCTHSGVRAQGRTLRGWLQQRWAEGPLSSLLPAALLIPAVITAASVHLVRFLNFRFFVKDMCYYLIKTKIFHSAGSQGVQPRDRSQWEQGPGRSVTGWGSGVRAGGREHRWPLEGAGGRRGKLLAAGSRGAAGRPRLPTGPRPARPLLRSQ